MAYKYGFFDNQTIGVDDLNGITARFVTGGIAINPKTVGDFTGFNSAIATAGVVPATVTSLKVYLQGGILYISPGSAFFDNGTFIEVTEAETLQYTKNVTNYIFLRTDAEASMAYPVCSSNKNGDKDILLAILNPDGTVTDKREYAKGKSPCYYSSVNNTLELDAVFKVGNTSYEFDIGTNNFTKMVLVNNTANYAMSFVEFNDDGSTKYSISYVKGDTRINGSTNRLEENGIVYVCHKAYSSGENRIETNVRISGTKLIFTGTTFHSHTYSNLSVKIYLM